MAKRDKNFNYFSSFERMGNFSYQAAEMLQEILENYGLSSNATADASFYHEHQLSNGDTAKFVTEFYDNVGNKKEANHGNE